MKMESADEARLCSACRLILPASAFGRDASRSSGFNYTCKPCINARSAAYYAANKDKLSARQSARHRANPDRSRTVHLRRTYGITPAIYDEMTTAQNGRCAICSKQTELVVDHCHTTKRVRGLLCRKCNVGIGNLDDDPSILQSAIRYLAP